MYTMDQDIARRVAIKRLLPEMTHPSLLARFVDEIRTVGRLEHPNSMGSLETCTPTWSPQGTP